jgi:hypothetical protein
MLAQRHGAFEEKSSAGSAREAKEGMGTEGAGCEEEGGAGLASENESGGAN